MKIILYCQKNHTSFQNFPMATLIGLSYCLHRYIISKKMADCPSFCWSMQLFPFQDSAVMDCL